MYTHLHKHALTSETRGGPKSGQTTGAGAEVMIYSE